MRKLGQHFLKNTPAGRLIIYKMIRAADISNKDVVLEVGPGRGILTEALLKKAGRVIAVEKDKKLVEFLKEKFKEHNNLEIIEADILKIKNLKLKIKNYKVVANIPYYITSRFLKTFLENPPAGRQPQKMVLMVQKEVGERIMAKPPHMNILAISVRVYGRPEIIAKVSRKHFSPQPKVDSVIILIDSISKSINIRCLNFWKIVKAGFSHKRKVLINNLKSSDQKEVFEKCGIKEKARAENLSLENWRCLAENLAFVDKKQNKRKQKCYN